MNPHNTPARLTEANFSVLDPGDGNTIPYQKWNQSCSLTVAGTETRVIPAPTKEGQRQTIFCAVNAGADTCTVTVADSSYFTGANDASLTFNAVDDLVVLESVHVGSDVYEWRVVAAEGGPATLGSYGDITATTGTFGDIVISAGSISTNGDPVDFALVMGINEINSVTAGAAVAITGLAAKSTSAAAIATTRVLTAADSGGTFTVAKTSAYAITLPTPAQGLRYKFVVLDTGANAVTISDGSAHLLGTVSINNTNTAMTGTTLTLASGGSVGDWVEFEGISATKYLVTGACIAASDITIA